MLFTFHSSVSQDVECLVCPMKFNSASERNTHYASRGHAIKESHWVKEQYRMMGIQPSRLLWNPATAIRAKVCMILS